MCGNLHSLIFPGYRAHIGLRCQVMLLLLLCGAVCLLCVLLIGVAFSNSAALWGQFCLAKACPGADGVAAASGAVWGAGVRDFLRGPRAVIMSCDARSKFEPFLPCVSRV